MRSPPFAIEHDVGIDADRGIVDEGLAIDLGKVDVALRAPGDHLGRLAEMERDAEVLGEMIERPERQDTEGNLGAGKHAGHGANAAVTAADHDRVDLSRLGALKRSLGEQLQLGPSAEFELGHDAERIER